jgi:predicted site-specific integrase-resolvase
VRQDADDEDRNGDGMELVTNDKTESYPVLIGYARVSTQDQNLDLQSGKL